MFYGCQQKILVSILMRGSAAIMCNSTYVLQYNCTTVMYSVYALIGTMFVRQNDTRNYIIKFISQRNIKTTLVLAQ